MSFVTPELDGTALALIALGVLALVLLVAARSAVRHRRTRALQDRFGPEYGRTVDELGRRDRAEAELLAREQRVRQLHLVPLSADDAARFHREWTSLQARFVDSPASVLVEADRLLREVMMRRGYAMGDFDRRAADLSVDHPRLVDAYRRAHEMAERSRLDGSLPSTEELRQAVIHFRSLFDELLVVATPDPAMVPPADGTGLRRAA